MFLHIDAAWAGVALALPEQRERLRLAEINKYADSFCTNMHKWGLVGFDCCECPGRLNLAGRGCMCATASHPGRWSRKKSDASTDVRSTLLRPGPT